MLTPLERMLLLLLLQKSCACTRLQYCQSQQLLGDLQTHALIDWRLHCRAQEWDAVLCMGPAFA